MPEELNIYDSVKLSVLQNFKCAMPVGVLFVPFGNCKMIPGSNSIQFHNSSY